MLSSTSIRNAHRLCLLGPMPDPWSQFLKKKTQEKDISSLDPDMDGVQSPLREVGTFPGELHEGAELDRLDADIDAAMEVTEGIGQLNRILHITTILVCIL